MLLWLVYLVLNTIVSIICYITNPIVVLFCDENGELPGFLKLWQTWDDSCDSHYFMTNVVPSFLDYGYSNHYIYIPNGNDYLLSLYNRTRCVSILFKELTTKEKIQRYFCRVWWLTRNCGYGFSFYIFGKDVSKSKFIIEEFYDNNNLVKVYAKDYLESFISRAWMYKNDSVIVTFGKYCLRYKVFIGWKLPLHDSGTMAMIANRALIVIDKLDE